MSFIEKCSACGQEIPSGSPSFALVMQGSLDQPTYDHTKLLTICFECFSGIVFGEQRRKGAKDATISNETQ